MNRDEYLKNLEFKNRRLLLKIYDKHSNRLKEQIAEAIKKGNDTTYLNKLKNEVDKEIIAFENDLLKYSKNATETSYAGGAKIAVAGLTAEQIGTAYQFGGLNREAMNVLAKVTYEPLSNMAQTLGRSTKNFMKRENFKNTQTVLKELGKFVDSDFLRKTGIEGVADVVVGSSTWQKAARDIKNKILDKGALKIPYYNKKGDVIRYVDAKDYSKMVSRTTTANIMREGAKDRILDAFGDDGDLVEIIGKSRDADPPCIPYQGKILSLEGKTKGFTTIAEARANGLFHPNCIHTFGVTDKVLEIYENKK